MSDPGDRLTAAGPVTAAPARHLSPVARRVWTLTQALVWGALTIVAVVVSLSGDGLMKALFAVPLALGTACTLAVPRLRWARWRWDIGDEGIDIQHGTLALRRTLVPWIRVQHVDTRRGLFEQAFGLSTVVVHTAAGSHTIPLLPAPEADELRARIAGLARTEDDEPADVEA
jgi:membrane protein YdbS with pleckstrin-like domain